jgi:hypothetical protein
VRRRETIAVVDNAAPSWPLFCACTDRHGPSVFQPDAVMSLRSLPESKKPMTKELTASVSTFFWLVAAVGFFLWSSPINAQKTTKTGPATEAEQIARALDGLKRADGFSIREVVDLGMSYLNSRRYSAAEALYRGAIERLDFTSEDYLELFNPPFWTSPSRSSGRMRFITEEAYPKLIKALVEQKKYEAALEVADRSRSRSLEVVIERRLRETNPAISTSPMDLQCIRTLAQDRNATFVVYSIISQAEMVAWVIDPKGAVHFVPLTLPVPWSAPRFVRTNGASRRAIRPGSGLGNHPHRHDRRGFSRQAESTGRTCSCVWRETGYSSI